ncbi:SPOR domain-containing protein, partial [Paenibacillus sp. EKM208P]
DNPQKGTDRIRGMNKNAVTTQEAELNEPEDLNKRISSRRFAPTLRVQEGWDDPFGRSAASWSDADVLPDSLEENEEAYHSGQEYRKRPPHPSRWKLVGSVASALVTGGMFG